MDTWVIYLKIITMTLINKIKICLHHTACKNKFANSYVDFLPTCSVFEYKIYQKVKHDKVVIC